MPPKFEEVKQSDFSDSNQLRALGAYLTQDAFNNLGKSFNSWGSHLENQADKNLNAKFAQASSNPNDAREFLSSLSNDPNLNNASAGAINDLAYKGLATALGNEQSALNNRQQLAVINTNNMMAANLADQYAALSALDRQGLIKAQRAAHDLYDAATAAGKDVVPINMLSADSLNQYAMENARLRASMAPKLKAIPKEAILGAYNAIYNQITNDPRYANTPDSEKANLAAQRTSDYFKNTEGYDSTTANLKIVESFAAGQGADPDSAKNPVLQGAHAIANLGFAPGNSSYYPSVSYPNTNYPNAVMQQAAQGNGAYPQQGIPNSVNVASAPGSPNTPNAPTTPTTPLTPYKAPNVIQNAAQTPTTTTTGAPQQSASATVTSLLDKLNTAKAQASNNAPMIYRNQTNQPANNAIANAAFSSLAPAKTATTPSAKVIADGAYSLDAYQGSTNADAFIPVNSDLGEDVRNALANADANFSNLLSAATMTPTETHNAQMNMISKLQLDPGQYGVLFKGKDIANDQANIRNVLKSHGISESDFIAHPEKYSEAAQEYYKKYYGNRLSVNSPELTNLVAHDPAANALAHAASIAQTTPNLAQDLVSDLVSKYSPKDIANALEKFRGIPGINMDPFNNIVKTIYSNVNKNAKAYNVSANNFNRAVALDRQRNGSGYSLLESAMNSNFRQVPDTKEEARAKRQAMNVFAAMNNMSISQVANYLNDPASPALAIRDDKLNRDQLKLANAFNHIQNFVSSTPDTPLTATTDINKLLSSSLLGTQFVNDYSDDRNYGNLTSTIMNFMSANNIPPTERAFKETANLFFNYARAKGDKPTPVSLANAAYDAQGIINLPSVRAQLNTSKNIVDYYNSITRTASAANMNQDRYKISDAGIYRNIYGDDYFNLLMYIAQNAKNQYGAK